VPTLAAKNALLRNLSRKYSASGRLFSMTVFGFFASYPRKSGKSHELEIWNLNRIQEMRMNAEAGMLDQLRMLSAGAC
jgi:hypothetical protein